MTKLESSQTQEQVKSWCTNRAEKFNTVKRNDLKYRKEYEPQVCHDKNIWCHKNITCKHEGCSWGRQSGAIMQLLTGTLLLILTMVHGSTWNYTSKMCKAYGIVIIVLLQKTNYVQLCKKLEG